MRLGPRHTRKPGSGSSPHCRAPPFWLSLSQLPLTSLPLPGQWFCRTLAVSERAKRKDAKVFCCPVRDTLACHLGQTHGIEGSEVARVPESILASVVGSWQAQNPAGKSQSREFEQIQVLHFNSLPFLFFKPHLCSHLELAISNHPAGPRLPVCRGDRGENST